jgi:hypothetical protein
VGALVDIVDEVSSVDDTTAPPRTLSIHLAQLLNNAMQQEAQSHGKSFTKAMCISSFSLYTSTPA